MRYILCELLFKKKPILLGNWINKVLYLFMFLFVFSSAKSQFRNDFFENDDYLFIDTAMSNDYYYDKLNRLNSQTNISLDYSKKVCLYIDAYMQRHKTKTRNILGRSELFFPVFEEYLNLYKLPEELKYIAVIESALKTRATSKSGARGLWQFMYSTARMFDLKITDYVDERYDYEKSTDAACRYLKYLYSIFGDWHLVIAAYNCGQGTVSKAIVKAGGRRDFKSISSFLPQETRNYLPAFIAANFVFAYYKEYNLRPINDNARYKFQLQEVVVENQLSLKYMASCLMIDYNLLKELNPIYEKYFIPKSETPARINIPKNKINDFEKFKF